MEGNEKMFLKSISITNFRGIKTLEIPFQKGTNLLIGDNGVGKTTILEGIAVGMEGLFTSVPGVRASKISQDDYRIEKERISDASSQVIYHNPSIKMLFDIEGEEEDCVREERFGNNRATTHTTGSACSYLREATNVLESQLPLLSYMGISRVTTARRSDYGKKLKNEMNDRRCGYIGCLNTTPDKNSILEWVKKMSYQSVLKEKTVNELMFFQTVISKLMKKMSDLPEEPKIFFSAAFDDIVYQSEDNDLPIGLLSAGYQSILWMTMDFAFRLALLNPTMTNPHDATGIVLIDEIDMHLHPKWQWNILDALESTFPNVQFIIATHAPIVISSCKNGTLLTIDENHHIEVSNGVYGYAVQDVIEYTQGSTGVIPELKTLYQNFEEAYIKRDYCTAEALYTEIRDRFPKSTEKEKAGTKLCLLRKGG
jgi:predicted ATP-binding protein involved in virulence